MRDVLVVEARVAIEYATDHVRRMDDDDLTALTTHARELLDAVSAEQAKRGRQLPSAPRSGRTEQEGPDHEVPNV